MSHRFLARMSSLPAIAIAGAVDANAGCRPAGRGTRATEKRRAGAEASPCSARRGAIRICRACTRSRP